MRTQLFCIVSLLLFSSASSGQTAEYKKLLDTAVSGSVGIFVSSKPITKIQLVQSEMWEYYNNYIEDSKLSLDTVMFAQIIANSEKPDTTIWSDQELDKVILVKNRVDNVNPDDVIRKFNLTDKNKIKYYKKLVASLNSTPVPYKVIYNYSRPVFDNSKQFAIVQSDNAHNMLSGGGGVKLFHRSDDGWEELGTIISWQY
jgi:hypothetical protein